MGRPNSLPSTWISRLRENHPAFGDDALPALDLERAVERRRSAGGTAWSEIEQLLEALDRAL